MIIKVIIVDENNEIVNGNVGTITAQNLLEFIKQAEKHNAKCLQFIDVTGDTFFSNKQMYQIQKELLDLKDDPAINQDIVNMIQRGINQGLLRDFDCLKLEGL